MTTRVEGTPSEVAELLDALLVEVQRLRVEIGRGDVWMARPAAAAAFEAMMPVMAAVDRWHDAASAVPRDDVNPHVAPRLVGRSLVDAVAALDAEALARTKSYLVWELRRAPTVAVRGWLTRALSILLAEEASRAVQ